MVGMTGANVQHGSSRYYSHRLMVIARMAAAAAIPAAAVAVFDTGFGRIKGGEPGGGACEEILGLACLGRLWVAVGITAEPRATHNCCLKGGKEVLGHRPPRYGTRHLHDPRAASQSHHAQLRQHTRVVFCHHGLWSWG